jgi:4-hydroxy-3-methylbut-2-enyl diphosphate reductase
MLGATREECGPSNTHVQNAPGEAWELHFRFGAADARRDGSMRIIRAEHLGMCFGVRDAIALARDTAQHEPLTVLGDLVHNETVLSELRARGVQIQNDAREVATQTVMITAHGASERKMSAVRERGLKVLEATCPLVHVAHRAVAKLVREGFHPVIIGRSDHVEVRGLTEDLAEFDVVLSEEDVRKLAERERFGVAAQTTQPIEKVRQLVGLIRQCFPNSEVRFIDTVCQPTKQRQNAAVELAQQCDVVIVIGGAHSNNTHELVRSCRRHCARVHHLHIAEDLQIEWFANASSVGITAGTSTPDRVINEVERRICQLAAGQDASTQCRSPEPHIA